MFLPPGSSCVLALLRVNSASLGITCAAPICTPCLRRADVRLSHSLGPGDLFVLPIAFGGSVRDGPIAAVQKPDRETVLGGAVVIDDPGPLAQPNPTWLGYAGNPPASLGRENPPPGHGLRPGMLRWHNRPVPRPFPCHSRIRQPVQPCRGRLINKF